MRPTSTSLGSQRSIPSIVLTSTGKKLAKKMTATLDSSPMPNQITSNGTQAIIGIWRTALKASEKNLWAEALMPMTTPKKTPATTAMA